MYVPRASSCASTGAAPDSAARTSICGAIASITHSTSLGGLELIGARGPSSPAQDAQTGVAIVRRAGSSTPHEPGEQRDRDVAERVQQRDEGVVRVKDSGSGIPPDVLPRI